VFILFLFASMSCAEIEVKFMGSVGFVQKSVDKRGKCVHLVSVCVELDLKD
jgi:hypothetical protein